MKRTRGIRQRRTSDGYIRRLTEQESYNLLELVETRSVGTTSDFAGRSTIFCSQYDTDEWYIRITPNAEEQNPMSDAIMDRPSS